ncbi:MAG: hypothetical protein JXA30_16875 [Deltaproteobacteria bacterium]|nr:hypothetical protein [Deltaproteobacteria bacterium]
MKRRQQIISAFIFTAAFLSATFSRPEARASESVAAEVFVILASDRDGTIAPALARISALRQPPFNGFRSMQVLQKSEIELKKGEPVTVTLPNGRRLMLKLKQQMPDGRSKVQLSINRPDQKDYLPLLEVIAKQGEPFFVAGQKYQGGTLVIGVGIGKRVSNG